MVTLSCNKTTVFPSPKVQVLFFFVCGACANCANNSIRMCQYDCSGSLVNTQELLKKHGFEVDCHVSRKDGILARIKASDDGTSKVLFIYE